MLTLRAEARDIFGKQLKSARGQGRLPVVVYGRGQAVESLFVPAKDFGKILKAAGESAMVTVETMAGPIDTLIHEVAFDPVSGEVIHVDFLRIDKTKTVEVAVPLNFNGVAPAVKDLGGILVKVLHELKIEVLPANIPSEIAVDIAKLEALDSQILIKDLNIPTGVKVLHEPEEVVAAISVAKEEPVETAPVDLSTIEVEKKGKKEEEGGEAGAGSEEGGGKEKKEEK